METLTGIEKVKAGYASINALHNLLILGDQYDTDGIPNSCWITKHPYRIHYTSEGEEYCFVEVTCKHGVQYGIQAFGDEAVALYIEANRCYMCGVSRDLQNNDVEPIEEVIDGVNYTFDSGKCALVFKKLRSVYGPGFHDNH
jgi:hypothetical protein